MRIPLCIMDIIETIHLLKKRDNLAQRKKVAYIDTMLYNEYTYLNISCSKITTFYASRSRIPRASRSRGLFGSKKGAASRRAPIFAHEKQTVPALFIQAPRGGLFAFIGNIC